MSYESAAGLGLGGGWGRLGQLLADASGQSRPDFPREIFLGGRQDAANAAEFREQLAGLECPHAWHISQGGGQGSLGAQTPVIGDGKAMRFVADALDEMQAAEA